MSTRIVDGRIWLDKAEVLEVKAKKEKPILVEKIKLSTPKMSMDDDVDNMDTIEVVDHDSVHSHPKLSTPRGRDGDVYENLYGQLKEELNEKQERLEMANYRVGQLEAQVRNSVPMLEYHRQNQEREKLETTLKSEIEDGLTKLKRLVNELKYEKLSKRLFLVILVGLLALQPLWLLLIYR
ncbi:MAG: hypothetical protein WC873_00215 [Candidatus Gracilibacteria bacterium]